MKKITTALVLLLSTNLFGAEPVNDLERAGITSEISPNYQMTEEESERNETMRKEDKKLWFASLSNSCEVYFTESTFGDSLLSSLEISSHDEIKRIYHAVISGPSSIQDQSHLNFIGSPYLYVRFGGRGKNEPSNELVESLEAALTISTNLASLRRAPDNNPLDVYALGFQTRGLNDIGRPLSEIAQTLKKEDYLKFYIIASEDKFEVTPAELTRFRAYLLLVDEYVRGLNNAENKNE